MKAVASLVPARFLTLISHLVFIITIFWSLDDVVGSCLPVSYSVSEYNNLRNEMIIAWSITLFLFLIEFIGFVGGFSMFNASQTLLSIGAHAGATVALSFFIFESLYCRLYWYIFSFCSVLPAITELLVMFTVWKSAY